MALTKSERQKRYREKNREEIKQKRKDSYKAFSFHLPREIAELFTETANKNNDVQRQLLVKFMHNYILENSDMSKEKVNELFEREYYSTLRK